MEWFTLDSSFRRSEIIEGFESFIWTERYISAGDFQIVTRSTPENKALLKLDTWIGMTDSYRTMKIETLSDAVAEDGVRKLTVTGRSMEAAFMSDRQTLLGIGTGYDYADGFGQEYITNQPAAMMAYLFTRSTVTTPCNVLDIMPFYHSGSLLPAGSIALPVIGSGAEMQIDVGDLYSVIKSLAEVFDVGFRLVRNGDAGEVYFETYRGDDRTSGQTARTPVIFTSGMETLDKTTFVKSSSMVKTVAYVYAQHGSREVYAPGHSSSDTGFSRRILYVKADDLNQAAGTTLNNLMQQRGLNELVKNSMVYAFDGEIPQSQPYVYQVDYGLGDHVEERSDDGSANTMIVTEQIFVSDNQGERSYPTLTLFLTAVPGTWDTIAPTQHWADYAGTVHWSDL